MSKLPKRLAKLHKEALALARCGRRLTLDERELVLANFHEGAEHMNSMAGAFFTPESLASDFSLEVGPGRILDLCAGIGRLSIACAERFRYRYAGERASSFVCVELNPAYVEVGRAVFPEATWICASAFDVSAYQHLGPFDSVISNPPFGRIDAAGFEGDYTGGEFEYRLVDLASRLAPAGTFIVPQMSAPFRYSGQQCFREEQTDRHRRFVEQTGIVLEPNCGIDTRAHRSEWKGVAPLVEIVCCDFAEVRARRTGAPAPVIEAAPAPEPEAFVLTSPEPKRKRAGRRVETATAT